MPIQDTDQVFVIVADCGGGDDHNPYTSLQAAKKRVGDETGIEIWRMTFAAYKEGAEPAKVGTQVYENW